MMKLDCEALFLDLSGVLFDGSRPISGSGDFLRRARMAGIPLRFVTNTATKPAARIVAEMAAMGFEVLPGELVTAPMAAHEYLRQHALRPFCLIHEAIRPDFEDVDQHDPNCVLLGDARDDLNYANLNRAFGLLKGGAQLIGIGLNKYFMDEHGLMLDTGAFIRGLEWAADVRALIIGKPGRTFFEQVVATTPFPAARCLMVGDDAVADVKGALDAGLQGCLVRTGKYLPGDEAILPKGVAVVDSVAQLRC